MGDIAYMSKGQSVLDYQSPAALQQHALRPATRLCIIAAALPLFSDLLVSLDGHGYRFGWNFYLKLGAGAIAAVWSLGCRSYCWRCCPIFREGIEGF